MLYKISILLNSHNTMAYSPFPYLDIMTYNVVLLFTGVSQGPILP